MAESEGAGVHGQRKNYGLCLEVAYILVNIPSPSLFSSFALAAVLHDTAAKAQWQLPLIYRRQKVMAWALAVRSPVHQCQPL